MYLYSVKDLKSGNYAAPFVAENDQCASRALQTTLFTSTESLLKMYPEDYILYEIGTFDNDTGIITDLEHVRIACCAELIDQYQRDKFDNVTKLDPKKRTSKCKK